MLRCNQCMQDKLVTEFYNANNNKRGTQYMCIECYKTYFKSWREIRTEKPQSQYPQSKRCLDCKRDKPISQFGKRSSSLDKHNQYCKPCWNIRTKIAQKKSRAKKLNNA